MKFIKSGILVMLLALVSFGYSKIISSDDTRKELEAVYAKIDAALENKDIKVIESLLSDDYEKRIGDKTLNRSEVIASMKQGFDAVKKIDSSETKIEKIEQVEGNEIVDYTQTVKATMKGTNGKDESMTHETKGRDWWVKNDDGKWICVSSERRE